MATNASGSGRINNQPFLLTKKFGDLWQNDDVVTDGVRVKGEDGKTYILKNYDESEGVRPGIPLHQQSHVFDVDYLKNIDSLANYNRFGMVDYPSGEGAPTSNGTIAAMIEGFVTRGQPPPGRGQQRLFWEMLDDPYDANYDIEKKEFDFINYTFFPGVRTVREIVEVIPYCVVYSSQKPGFTDGADYVAFTTSPPDSTRMFVDRELIADQNCEMSIIAALNSSRPMNDSYLTFFPCIGAQALYAASRSGSYHKLFGVRGASLGLAVQAAICGMPSVMYTGYTGAIMPDVRIARSREMMQKLSDSPTYNIGRGMQLLESVTHMAFKVAFAVMNKIPLVFPRNSTLQQPMELVLKRIQDMNQAPNVMLTMAKNIYTIAQLEDGISVIAAKTPLFMAASMADAATLAALAAVAFTYPEFNRAAVQISEQQMQNFDQATKARFARMREKAIATRKKAVVTAHLKKEHPAAYAEASQKKKLAKLETTAAKRAAQAAARLEKQKQRVAVETQRIREKKKAPKLPTATELALTTKRPANLATLDYKTARGNAKINQILSKLPAEVQQQLRPGQAPLRPAPPRNTSTAAAASQGGGSSLGGDAAANTQ